MDKPHNLNALIRIEDAIKVLCRKTCNPGVFCPDTYCDEMWDALADIERVDAAPVVRCRDCKYYAGEGMYCAWNIIVQFDHFYCYHGDRKELP